MELAVFMAMALIIACAISDQKKEEFTDLVRRLIVTASFTLIIFYIIIS